METKILNQRLLLSLIEGRIKKEGKAAPAMILMDFMKLIEEEKKEINSHWKEKMIEVLRGVAEEGCDAEKFYCYNMEGNVRMQEGYRQALRRTEEEINKLL